MLAGWNDQLPGIDNIHFENVSDQPTPGNRPLNISEIRANLQSLKMKLDLCIDNGFKIVTLGRTAEKAVKMLGMDHYSMPHPSGLNRQLNDKKFVEEKINGLKVFLESV